MKKAVILHGTGGTPQDHWIPWLKNALEEQDFTVWAPQLPDSNRPNKDTYHQFLTDLGYDFSDAILIGHSSGATTILNLLERSDFSHIRQAVCVGVFLNETLTRHTDWYEEGQFDTLFPENGFRGDVLKRKAAKFSFIHGDDDPYCDYNDAQNFARELEAEFITIKNGKHLSGSSGIVELPEIISVINQDTAR